MPKVSKGIRDVSNEMDGGGQNIKKGLRITFGISVIVFPMVSLPKAVRILPIAGMVWLIETSDPADD